jgi:1-acyl-sn-glycerol-3-phosphate acyltransferase
MNPVYWLGHSLFRNVSRAFFELHVVGAENMHLEGPAIIASNHVSYLDPPFIGAAFDEDICFFARKSLMRFAFTRWLLNEWQCIPVDRDKPDPSTLKAVFQRLKSGRKVIIFPEGTRSLDGRLQAGEAGVGMMVARAQVPVIPVRIFGAFEALPRDRKLPRPSRITIAVGKPWMYRAEDFPNAGRELYQQISHTIMDRIAELREEES